MKFEKLFKSKDYLPASLVAEEEDGTGVLSLILSHKLLESISNLHPQELFLIDIYRIDRDINGWQRGSELCAKGIPGLHSPGAKPSGFLTSASFVRFGKVNFAVWQHI